MENLSLRRYSDADVQHDTRRASDHQYAQRVRAVDAATPARFNADERRLFEASGCAGKLAVFAVRLDTFPAEARQQVFYIGTDRPGADRAAAAYIEPLYPPAGGRGVSASRYV